MAFSEDLMSYKTVSSLLHSKASSAAFVAPPWPCRLSIEAANFCSSRHTCSRYFLRIWRYELKALLRRKDPHDFLTLTQAEHKGPDEQTPKKYIQQLSFSIHLWACVRRAICSALSLLWEELSETAAFSDSWTKASRFFKACSLEKEIVRSVGKHAVRLFILLQAQKMFTHRLIFNMRPWP